MTEDNFIPVSDAEHLSALCAASLRANGLLMAAMLTTLPADKHKQISRLLAGGGSVGIETLIDRGGANLVRLVGREREGSHRTFATVSTGSSIG